MTNYPVAVSDAVDLMVTDTPIKLVGANDKRSLVNLWAGEHAIWYGRETVRPGTIGNKVLPGEHAEIRIQGEIWVVRASGTASRCGFSQEIYRHG